MSTDENTGSLLLQHQLCSLSQGISFACPKRSYNEQRRPISTSQSSDVENGFLLLGIKWHIF